MDPSDSSKTSTFSKIWSKAKEWVNYYFCFCKGALFASGLLFSDKLIHYSIVGLLITYLIDKEDTEVMNAAMLTMTQRGVSSLLEIVMTFISVALIGRFLVITISTLFYIGGLVLLYVSLTEELIIGYSVVGILLLGVGQAGVQPLIREFIVEQFKYHEPADETKSDKDRPIARKDVWCRVVWSFSALAAFLIHFRHYKSPEIIFKVSLWATGSSLILFLCGTVGLYHFKRLDIPLDRKAFLVKMKTRNRKQDEGINTRPEEQQKQRKRKLKMGCMWTTFLVFGLVLSAGRTFFPWQGRYMIDSKILPYFLVLQSISRKVISYVFEFLLSKWVSKLDEEKKKAKEKKAKLVRIWIGILLSVVCFTVSWLVERDRLKYVHDNNIFVGLYEYDVISMSIFWFVPQFCLLGFMEGLAQDGLDEFMFDLFPESRKDYVSAINALVIGLGSFSNMLCVYLNRGLFEGTVNTSRLDLYYMRLAILTLVNLCYYSGISILFYHRSKKTAQGSQTAGSDVNKVEVGEQGQPQTDENVKTTEKYEKSQTADSDGNTVDQQDEEVINHNKCSCLSELLFAPNPSN